MQDLVDNYMELSDEMLRRILYDPDVFCSLNQWEKDFAISINRRYWRARDLSYKQRLKMVKSIIDCYPGEDSDHIDLILRHSGCTNVATD